MQAFYDRMIVVSHPQQINLRRYETMIEKGTGKIAILENSAILLVVLSALTSILGSVMHVPGLPESLHGNAEISHTLQRMFGLMQLLVAWRLYRRMRLAWLITIGALMTSITLHAISIHTVIRPLVLCELAVLMTLILCAKDFSRRSDRISVQWGAMAACGSAFLVLLNSALGFFLLRIGHGGRISMGEALIHTVRTMFFMEPNSLFTFRASGDYLNFTIGFNWLCVFGCLFFLLKPLVYNPIANRHDRERVLKLVRAYGQNPMSYLALEDDKRYFFGKAVKGVAAYGVAGGVTVCCGDPICSDEDLPLFLSEFVDFCKENETSIVLLNVTDRFISFYRQLGFGLVKYGEDACFNLTEYKLAGGKVAKVRAAINHANKDGITVEEYCPNQGRDKQVEGEMHQISREWLSMKSGSEMGFMLGGDGLSEPLDRRYFYARSSQGEMLGFVVFIPYESGNAYLADVTRRKKNAPQGVLEKITWDAFQVFKEEGVSWGSLGLVPLANLKEVGKEGLTTRLFEFVYENLNGLYGFKALHHAKEKYAPTHWLPRYVAYRPGTFLPQMAYAIVKVQNPGGLREMFPLRGRKEDRNGHH